MLQSVQLLQVSTHYTLQVPYLYRVAARETGATSTKTHIPRPAARPSSPAPKPPPRTGLSKTDADNLVAIKTDLVALHRRNDEIERRMDLLEADSKEYQVTTNEKLKDINNEFNDIAQEREEEGEARAEDRAAVAEMKQRFDELSFGRRRDAEDPDEEGQMGKDDAAVVADNPLKVLCFVMCVPDT